MTLDASTHETNDMRQGRKMQSARRWLKVETMLTNETTCACSIYNYQNIYKYINHIFLSIHLLGVGSAFCLSRVS